MIRFREFLLPQRRLARSGVDENPLVLRRRRRLHRLPRWILCRMVEGILVALGLLILSRPALPGPGLSPAILLYGVSLLLLRYHLLANDQSHHTKSLDSRQLEHLILTRLTRDEYFLHHFLLFCLKYRVLVGLVVLAGIRIGTTILSTDWHWITWKFYDPMIGLLILVLLTWVGGVAQYVLEWRLFAGGHLIRFQLLISLLLSLFLGALSTGLVLLLMRFPSSLALILGLAAFFGSAWAVYRLGLTTYREADAWLWQTFIARDPDWQVRLNPPEPRLRDFLFALFLPWSPRRRALHPSLFRAHSILSRREKAEVLAAAITHGILFGVIYSCARYLVYFSSLLSRNPRALYAQEYWEGFLIHPGPGLVMAVLALAAVFRLGLALSKRHPEGILAWVLSSARAGGFWALGLAVAVEVLLVYRLLVEYPSAVSSTPGASSILPFAIVLGILILYFQNVLFWVLVLTLGVWTLRRNPSTRGGLTTAGREILRTVMCAVVIALVWTGGQFLIRGPLQSMVTPATSTVTSVILFSGVPAIMNLVLLFGGLTLLKTRLGMLTRADSRGASPSRPLEV